MHLPHQDLGRLGGGDPLAAGGGEPHRVTRSPARPAPSRSTAPRGTNRCRNGASGSSHALAGLQPGGVQRGVPVLDPDGGGAVVLVHAGGDRDQAAG